MIIPCWICKKEIPYEPDFKEFFKHFKAKHSAFPTPQLITVRIKES